MTQNGNCIYRLIRTGSILHFQVNHQQNNMFALKQVSLMAILIASACGAPQLGLNDLENKEGTDDYINVSNFILQPKWISVLRKGTHMSIPRLSAKSTTLLKLKFPMDYN